MKLLITNDDGILAPVLPHLIRFAKTFASEVVVVAPKVEQSGKSHAIDFTRPIEIKEVPIAEGARCFSMDSTPADCVRFAVLGMKEKFDLVLSGINRGFNLGGDLVYSGTAGAVFEAARLGIPGIALSTAPDDFLPAIASLPDLYRFFKDNALLSHHGWYNVNLPKEPKGFRITRQGGIYYTDEFRRIDAVTYEQVGTPAPLNDTDPETDVLTLFGGYISITPLNPTRTDMHAFQELKNDLNKT